MDLMTPGQWRRLQGLGRDDTQVGLGWRSGRITAIVGYVKPDEVRPPSFLDGRDRFAAPRPLLGLSFALHYR